MIKFKAQIQNSDLVNWPVSKVNRLLRHEFEKLGRWWHRVARPRHFNRGAFQRYGYSPRSRGYSRRKQRKSGHTRPLVLSGETYRLTANHRIQATKKSVTVFYPSARKLNFKPRGSKVNMRAEFEAVSQGEIRHMADLMVNSIERKLQTAARNGGTLYVRS